MTSDVRRWWGGLQDKSRDGVDENNLHIKSQFVRRWRYQRNYTPARENDIHFPTMVLGVPRYYHGARKKERTRKCLLSSKKHNNFKL